MCALRTAKAALWVLVAVTGLWGQTNVLTGRADTSRDGLYPNETYLTTANVNVTTFGNLYSYNVDGYVSAQPLYVSGVSIGGSTHNVVYVATEHDSVYAFDADNPGSPLWQASLVSPGISTVPINIQGCGGVSGLTEVGILGTPVIDLSSNTLYVVAKVYFGGSSKTSTAFELHALDITSGAEKFGGPTEINASVNSINGTINFSPLTQLQRPALLLLNGTVFIAFGSNGCDQQDHGWLLAYNASTLVQVGNGVFNSSPDVAQGSAIWMSGDGPAADSAGNIYLATANGDFDIDTGGSDYGDSVVKLQLGANGLSVVDYFTPFDQSNMNTSDLDLGSGGPMLLPSPQSGTYPDLLVVASKTGTVYVINRDALGHYDTDGNNNNQIPQSLANAVRAEYGTATYWNNTVYFSAHNDFLKAFVMSAGALPATATAQSATAYIVVGVPAASANGNSNGIVWIVRYTKNNGPMALYAYNGTPVGTLLPELYDTNQNSTRDALGTTAHFVTPIITNGKVYVGTQTQLKVYGLLPTLSVTAGNNQSGTVGTTLPLALSVQATDSYLHQPQAGVTVTFSDGLANGTFNPKSINTDSNGIASTQYTLPTTAKTIAITATSSGYVSASLTETSTAGAPTALFDISGGYQSATVGTMLAAPLVVRLKDTYGNVVPNVQVTFSDNNAKGWFTPPNPTMTDSTGTATMTYTVPTKAESITITPSAGSLTGKFTEKSIAGAVASISVVSGNNQSGTAGTQLPNPLVTGVKDQYGNPVPGVTVTYADGGAGGTFSTATQTNNQGQASVTYTLPNTAQKVTITATIGSFSAQFTETAK